MPNRLTRSATCLMAAAMISGHPLGLNAQESNPSWTFQSVESADLLFHGLAVVGFQGFSSLPLYNREYPEQVQAAKEAIGVYPTSLDGQVGRFREAFESDSTFELLHFLPLYFGAVETPTMLQALSEVAEASGPRSAGEDAAFASSVVAAVLRSRNQLRILGEFTNALEDEWSVFLQRYSNAEASRQRAILARASRTWNEQVAPAVSDFLDTRDAKGGIVMVSPALGPEGRVFSGDPESTGDDIYAVSSAQHRTGLGISAFLLKELCYPVASGGVEALGMSRDRVTAEQLSGRLAVRCGAELLESGSGTLADEYRETFMAAAAASGISGRTFEAAYPVETSVLERLRQALRN